VIVVDASAMVEALVGRNADPDLLDALVGDVDAPHLLDVEVLSVLRGLLLGGKLEPSTAENARRDYLALNITRHEVSPLADRGGLGSRGPSGSSNLTGHLADRS
jgi:predicted nucleic acid-binding protein